MKKKNKIGETLIKEGIITKEHLDKALAKQKGKSIRIGKILIEMGHLDEVQIAKALSDQLSLPLVNCKNYTPPEVLLKLVPKDTAEQKIVLPLEIENNRMIIAMANPLDWNTADDISFKANMKLDIVVASETNILNAIDKCYGATEYTWDILREIPSYDEAEFVKEETTTDKQTINIHSLYKESEAPPIVKLVTMIIADAINVGASDIHIEPREDHVQVRYRIDGELKNIHSYTTYIHNSVISRIKIISNLDITNRRLPQDGRSALRLKQKTVDLRISTMPSVHGEKIVMRILDPISGLIPLGQLGISDHILSPLIKICTQPQGMLLVTGPTGSGKTTTLYSILQLIQEETKNIITLENPVEYKLNSITQVGINDEIGFSFANALRTVLRQDPDIIMVGEVRDLETAQTAARSALTGHLVLSTLHTNDTVSSITRLMDIGLEPFLVTAAISGILAQRLVRMICPECKVETDEPIEISANNIRPLKAYYIGEGCDHCNNTGYKGRIGIYELLTMTSDLKRLVSKNCTEDDLWECLRYSNTTTLFEDAWVKVEAGITSVEEVISKIPNLYDMMLNTSENPEPPEGPAISHNL